MDSSSVCVGAQPWIGLSRITLFTLATVSEKVSKSGLSNSPPSEIHSGTKFTYLSC